MYTVALPQYVCLKRNTFLFVFASCKTSIIGEVVPWFIGYEFFNYVGFNNINKRTTYTKFIGILNK